MNPWLIASGHNDFISTHWVDYVLCANDNKFAQLRPLNEGRIFSISGMRTETTHWAVFLTMGENDCLNYSIESFL